ncbi:hypothetical protein PIB30_056465 [Stylosanthes scabra]|uniref:Uncharacterized protein n=1 Tax=Stylosanthes scabra TaxID=79078 RepID=A0ABU6YI83_9FABA|nr:hypothetical protein [Stylosanthes scabra]
MDIKRRFWCGICLDEFTFCYTLWWICSDRNNSIFNSDDEWSPLKCGYRDVCCEIDSLDTFLAAQLHFNPDHVADADLIVKIHEIFHWNWNAQLILIQRTASAATDSLAKHAIETTEEYVELLEPLHYMRSLLWNSPSSVKS